MTCPLVSCLCPTYEPRESLREAIECFCDQDYQHKELIVLDDHPNGRMIGPYQRVKYVHTHVRFRSLPEKYNALAGLSRGDILMPWEDDDLYEPWHISAHVAAIGDHQDAVWSKPSVCLQQMPDGKLYRRSDKNRLARFHASIALTRELFCHVGGWPLTKRADFDRQFQERLCEYGSLVDPIECDDRPSYTNRWRQSSQSDDDVTWYNHMGKRTYTRG